MPGAPNTQLKRTAMPTQQFFDNKSPITKRARFRSLEIKFMPARTRPQMDLPTTSSGKCNRTRVARDECNWEDGPTDDECQ